MYSNVFKHSIVFEQLGLPSGILNVKLFFMMQKQEMPILLKQGVVITQ